MSQGPVRIAWRPIWGLVPSWELAFYDAISTVDQSGRAIQPIVGPEWTSGELIVIAYNAAEHGSILSEGHVDGVIEQVVGFGKRIALSACGRAEAAVTREDVFDLLKAAGDLEHCYPNRAENPDNLTEFITELLELHPRILERRRRAWSRILGGGLNRARSADPYNEWLKDQ